MIVLILLHATEETLSLARITKLQRNPRTKQEGGTIKNQSLGEDH